jgi:hypothetical protein
MSKEVENHICEYCESEFKLVFVTDEVSGLPKFCPFCGEETFLNGVDTDQEIDYSDYEEEPEL